MKTIKTLFLSALLFFAPVVRQLQAQTPVPAVALQGVTGTAPVLVASVAGTPGATQVFYVLMANFAGGSIPSNIITINNAPGTLNSTNFISFLWSPVSGVVTYDLLKLTSAALPSGSNSVVLRAGLSTTTTNTTDQGGSLSAYTIAAPPVSPVGIIQVNSRDYTQPQFDFVSASGPTIRGFARNGVPLPVFNNDISASATGITLTTTQLINGIMTHSPAGAVADTTPTATAIIAALPSCYVSGTTASTFEFTLLNTAAGANAITLTGGTNVTIVGTAAVPQNFAGNFRGIVTACTGTPALKLYSLGQTAF